MVNRLSLLIDMPKTFLAKASFSAVTKFYCTLANSSQRGRSIPPHTNISTFGGAVKRVYFIYYICIYIFAIKCSKSLSMPDAAKIPFSISTFSNIARMTGRVVDIFICYGDVNLV